MSPPRIEVRGATIALTRRCTMRKAFLAPWHPLVGQIWLYALADAQAHTGVAIHQSTLVVNHHHTTVTPSVANLPEFTRRFHADLSGALNTLLARERYDAPRELFDDRQVHQLRLLDAAAQASHLVYERNNAVAAGLVSRPEHMPLPTLDFRLWKAGYVEVERPPLYFDPRNRPPTRRVLLTPFPELYRAFEGDLDALVHHMSKLSEHGRRALLEARGGRAPMGAKALRRLHPWSEPRTLRETGGQPVRTFRVGARGIVATKLEVDAAEETTGFRGEHREVRLARRDGDAERVYPYGTYRARVHEGAPVESEPRAESVLARPGPTLDEVKAELAERRGDERPEANERHQRRNEMLDEVRAAFTHEAGEILEHDDLEMCRKVPVSDAAVSAERSKDERKGVEVRHRFEPRPKRRSSAVRLVTLRDRRRGRPRQSRHGSDPPR